MTDEDNKMVEMEDGEARDQEQQESPKAGKDGVGHSIPEGSEATGPSADDVVGGVGADGGAGDAGGTGTSGGGGMSDGGGSTGSAGGASQAGGSGN